MILSTESLDRVDWDFPRSGTDNNSAHSIHWFAGNFIPQIPNFLTQILSSPGNVVFDPFCGCGTTAIEALRLRRKAICGDRMSSSIFLSQGKLAAALHPLTMEVKLDLLARFTWDYDCESDAVGKNGEGADSRLIEWYSEYTLRQLHYIWKVIEEIDRPARSILELCFSDLLFACLSTRRARTSTGNPRRHHWGWVADNVRPKVPIRHNAIDGFRSRLMALPDEVIAPVQEPLLIQHDARRLSLQDSSVDLILTSPPYIGVIDYVRANRMLYLWMGWPMDEERNEEIGARYKRGRKNIVNQYVKELEHCWDEFQRVLRRGGACAVIIGESRAFPGTAARAISGLGNRLHLVWGPVARTPSRRRVADRADQDAKEIICVFEKL